MSQIHQGDHAKQHHLHPSVLADASTETSGLIAGELAAEEAELYGLTNQSKPADVSPDDPLHGYALPKAQLDAVIFSIYTAAFLSALDVTIVTTLLTLIASDLNEVKNISWIGTGYLLSAAAFQPIFGRLSDIFGRKPLLLLCSALFAVGCYICVTDSLLWLVIGRFVTGCGGSGMNVLGTITLSDLIPLRDRGYYQGLTNIAFGLGTASGGIVGGLIADWLGWKWVFILQIPLAILVGVSIFFFLNLPEGSPGLGAQGVDIKGKLKRVDFAGASFLVSSLITFMIAASLGGRNIAFASKTFIGLITLGFALLGGFIYAETYIAAEPIIPLELMTVRTVVASSLANWFFTMGVFAYLFYVPIFYSSVMGLSATQTGQRLIPNFFGVSFGSFGAGIYMRRTGRYYNLSVAAGILSVIGILRLLTLSVESSLFKQYTLLLPTGIGYSTLLTVTLLALISSVPVKYQACTTSIQYTFRSTGSTIGVTVASAIFQGLLQSKLTSKINKIIPDKKEAANIISRALENTKYVEHAPESVQKAIRESYALGCKGAFYFSVATVVIGFIASLFMREHKLHTSMDRD